ncbi:MAG: beta-galactosidase [Actinomycetaceae bacterium]|nr:beta-galactosidase [Actinomycetaceae bacterium]
MSDIVPFYHNRIEYGADYNPEQWSPHTQRKDIELMAQAGVSLVSLGIFSWDRLEPKPDHYSFKELIETMDILHEHSIRVDLATATASPPAWMATLFPDTLPVDKHGQQMSFGSRQQYSPSSQTFRKRTAQLVTHLARAVKDHPALCLWHVSNEYGCHVWESFDEESIAAFQAWLRSRYTTIDNLNNAWTTDFWSQRYNDFSQITAPAHQPTFVNPAQLMDWRRFCSDALLECYLHEKRILRTHTPTVPVTTNFMELFPWINYWSWAPHLDVLSEDSYPDPADAHSGMRAALSADLQRSLAGKKPWLLMEQVTKAVQWRTYNSPKRPGQFALWSLSRVARGARGILQFQWRQSQGGAETFHSGMVPHDMSASSWKDSCELGRTLQNLSSLAHPQLRPSPIAIILDWDNIWAAEALIGPSQWDHSQAVKRWYKTFFEAGYGVDFVRSSDNLDTYRVVIAPQLALLDSQCCERLEQAARRGAEVIVSAPAGIANRNCQAYLDGYTGPLKDALGVRVVEHWAATPHLDEPWLGDETTHPLVDRISSAVATPSFHEKTELVTDSNSPLARAARQALQCEQLPALQGNHWAEVVSIDADDVHILAVFAATGPTTDIAGSPALTRRRIRKGALWYCATDPQPVLRAIIAKLACTYAGCYTASAHLPRGVELIERDDARFYLNHSDSAQEILGVVGHDLISSTQCSGHLVIPPRSSAVIIPGNSQ